MTLCEQQRETKKQETAISTRVDYSGDDNNE